MPPVLRRIARHALLTGAFCAALAAAGCARDPAPALVVSSIRPLDLIVREVAGPLVTARPLPGIDASPHDFVLTPSDLRLIRNAEVLFWIGPVLEGPLARVLERLPEVPAVALQDTLGAPGEDPHLWLDPRLALGIGRYVAAELERRGLVPRAELAPRLAVFEARMREREAAISAELAGLERVPFLSMHDGYRHFVRRFGLNQVAALPARHEHQPGARAVAGMHAAALRHGAVCLLRERADSASLAASIAAQTGMRTVELDPLARETLGGEHGFDAFLEHFSGALATCLRGGPRESAS